jgi:hypothetical protein
MMLLYIYYILYTVKMTLHYHCVELDRMVIITLTLHREAVHTSNLTRPRRTIVEIRKALRIGLVPRTIPFYLLTARNTYERGTPQVR